MRLGGDCVAHAGIVFVLPGEAEVARHVHRASVTDLVGERLVVDGLCDVEVRKAVERCLRRPYLQRIRKVWGN